MPDQPVFPAWPGIHHRTLCVEPMETTEGTAHHLELKNVKDITYQHAAGDWALPPPSPDDTVCLIETFVPAESYDAVISTLATGATPAAQEEYALGFDDDEEGFRFGDLSFAEATAAFDDPLL